MKRRFPLVTLAIGFVLAVLIVVPPAACENGGQTATASYLGGSLVSIPAYANGQLDWSRGNVLQFRCGEQNTTWPYTSIVGLTLERPPARPLWKKAASLGVLALPMFSDNGERELTIHYKNENGLAGSVVFGLPVGEAELLVSVLESRTGKQSAVLAMSPERMHTRKEAVRPADNPHISADGAWWGDTYWRTPRNADRWPKSVAAKADSAQPVNVASSKEE
jgi:hypothetical protein